MTTPTKLIIQIPCFNEEATLPETLADLPRQLEGIDVVEWLVIDDGSTDDTVAVAEAHGVDHVVRLGKNRGLAAAFTAGIEYSLGAGATVIVNTDADNQYQGASIPDLVAPILEGDAEMVVGERPINSIDDFSFVKKRLQAVGSGVVRRLSGTTVRDAASGFRAYHREAAMKLQVFGSYTYTMETLVQAGRSGTAVTSVPIGVNPKTRDSRLAKSTMGYVWRTSQSIVRSYALYQPFRFFFAIGLIPFLAGAGLLTRWLILWAAVEPYQSRVPSLLAGIGLVLLAVQVWAVAFLADLQAANARMLRGLTVNDRRRRHDDSGPTRDDA